MWFYVVNMVRMLFTSGVIFARFQTLDTKRVFDLECLADALPSSRVSTLMRASTMKRFADLRNAVRFRLRRHVTFESSMST